VVDGPAQIARTNIEGSYLYSGSKIATEALTRSLAMELIPRGITANCGMPCP
jgi:NAD(P)-dependent dehydrogenase (short-subunit alcohol dehydrogenase family)